jgi:hypothetical protein
MLLLLMLLELLKLLQLLQLLELLQVHLLLVIHGSRVFYRLDSLRHIFIMDQGKNIQQTPRPSQPVAHSRQLTSCSRNIEQRFDRGCSGFGHGPHILQWKVWQIDLVRPSRERRPGWGGCRDRDDRAVKIQMIVPLLVMLVM